MNVSLLISSSTLTLKMERKSQRLNKDEKVFVVKTFYENSNKSETCRLFKEKFRRNIKRDTVSKLILRFEDTGSTDDLPRSGRPVTACSPENCQIIRVAFSLSPTKSTRRASMELNISGASIRRLLSQLRLKAYRPHLVHAMSEDDPDRRVEFCEAILNKCLEDRSFLAKVFWSDEAHFKLNGHVNRHNTIYWATENPHKEIERDVNAPGVTVWAAICCDALIGPFFFPGNVTSESYTIILREKFYPVVANWPDIQERWFQHDGAPAHYGNVARKWLTDTFGNRWIGRRGGLEWPPRSPDLTPPDFFLWGVIKEAVYSTKPRSLEELKERITNTFLSITPELCHKVCSSMENRVLKCIKVNGGQFEYL